MKKHGKYDGVKKTGRTLKAYQEQPQMLRYQCARCIGALGLKRPQKLAAEFTFRSAKELKHHSIRHR